MSFSGSPSPVLPHDVSFPSLPLRNYSRRRALVFLLVLLFCYYPCAVEREALVTPGILVSTTSSSTPIDPDNDNRVEIRAQDCLEVTLTNTSERSISLRLGSEHIDVLPGPLNPPLPFSTPWIHFRIAVARAKSIVRVHDCPTLGSQRPNNVVLPYSLLTSFKTVSGRRSLVFQSDETDWAKHHDYEPLP